MFPEISLFLSLWNTIRDTIIFWKSDGEKTEKNGEILELNEKLEEKNEEIQSQRRIISQKEERVDKYEKIIKTLQDQNISVEDLVEEYWRDSTILLISFSNQKDSRGITKKFVKEKLSKDYELINLTSKTWVIPPAQFPERLESASNRNEIQEWLNEGVFSDYPDHKVIVPFATAVDLKNVHSHSDFDSGEVGGFASTLDEELGLSKLMSPEDFSQELASNNINLADVIESGHITFFVSNYVSDEQLEEISSNRESIEKALEKDLGDVSLQTLADDRAIKPLERALSEYVTYPKKVARGAVGVAEMWKKGLNQMWDDPTSEENTKETPKLPEPE
jgi:hypothetical protein